MCRMGRGEVLAERLADRLVNGRDRGFVGRRTENAVFAELLGRPAGAVVHIHGPGGVGKSTLLHHFARQGAAAGRTTAWPLPRELGDDGYLASLAGTPALLLLLDAADPVVEDPAIISEHLLPALRPDALVVLASRAEPPLEWRTDPAWHGLLHPVRLGHFDRTESGELLRRHGVPDRNHGPVVEATGGHPLALALAADLWRQTGSGLLRLTDSPSVVHGLLARLLETVPSAAHRGALEACAQVLVTTEPLLAELLDVPDARDLFDWLRGLSAVHCGSRGLSPHDLVRRALDAELRWRDPDRRAALNKRAAAYYQQFFDRGDTTRQRSVLTDFAFLHRENQSVAALLAPLLDGTAARRSLQPLGWERLTVLPAAERDLPALYTMTRRHEGGPSADLLTAWSTDPAATTSVVREPGGPPAGYSTTLTLGREAGPAEPADPAATAARAWLLDGSGGDLREGEKALLVRYWMSAEHYQDASEVQLLITLRLTHDYLVHRPPALTLLPFADPQRWEEACAYVDFTRAPAADFTVGGRHFGVFVHDWRRTPPLSWLNLLSTRQSAADPWSVTAPPPPQATRLLSHEEFAAGVRQALRGLGRADGLARADLLRSRLVVTRTAGDDGGNTAATLRRVILGAAAQLEASPLDRRAYRALHHTYLQPAGSQQRAADLLGLPMSTYRRHLAAGLERLTELLWRQESEVG